MQSTLIQEVINFNELNIIDVREADEVIQGRIPNSLHLPLSDIENKFQELDLSRKYYIVCVSGRRSLRACQFLEDKGFNVVNLMGGMNAYRSLNLPLSFLK